MQFEPRIQSRSTIFISILACIARSKKWGGCTLPEVRLPDIKIDATCQFFHFLSEKIRFCNLALKASETGKKYTGK
jgi:hypothetical protein